jgi:hypothetical protein
MPVRGRVFRAGGLSRADVGRAKQEESLRRPGLIVHEIIDGLLGMLQRFLGVAGAPVQQAARLGQLVVHLSHRVGLDDAACQAGREDGHDAQKEHGDLPQLPQRETG